MESPRHPLRAVTGGLFAAAALALPAVAGEAVIETGVLSPIYLVDNIAEYQYDWTSSEVNKLILELDFVLKDGFEAPTLTQLLDNVYYGVFYQPDPSASNEYFGGCGGTFICNAEFVSAPAGVTRVRYTTYWGHKSDIIVRPLSPIQINFYTQFDETLPEEPFEASYRLIAVPEPAAWTLMILGFGAAGARLRGYAAGRARRALALGAPGRRSSNTVP